MIKTLERVGQINDQLIITRGMLLQHIAANQIPPQYLMKHASRYQAVIEWEELILAAIDPEAGRLRAIVVIHRPDGYSGLYRRHGSIEYVRFFIDWGTNDGFEPISLAHFKICDHPDDVEEREQPRFRRVFASFDQERYWGSMLSGQHPKVKAVLSWHRVPEMDPDFVPLFGNAVESKICIDSEQALIDLIPTVQGGALPHVSEDRADLILQ
jgi:hypothetical protein